MFDLTTGCRIGPWDFTTWQNFAIFFNNNLNWPSRMNY